MTVAELRAILDRYPDDRPVFFRCHAPVIGNIREVESVEPSTFGMFGMPEPCLLLDSEP